MGKGNCSILIAYDNREISNIIEGDCKSYDDGGYCSIVLCYNYISFKVYCHGSVSNFNLLTNSFFHLGNYYYCKNCYYFILRDMIHLMVFVNGLHVSNFKDMYLIKIVGVASFNFY